MTQETVIIPFVPGVKEGDKDAAKKVQKMLTEQINEWEGKGWTFDNIHTVYIMSEPGCLGALAGRKTIQFPLTYITFKKP